MKKTISLVLALVMILSLAACGQSRQPAAENKAEAVSTAKDAAEETPAAKEETEDETPNASEPEEVFADWNGNAASLGTLIDYVESVTDDQSEDYIPESDRIAVFDMDGTLVGELFPTYFVCYVYEWRVLKDPAFAADEAMKKTAEEIRECGLTNAYTAELVHEFDAQSARAFAGMTKEEYAAYITEILLHDVDGFDGMTYGEAFFRPMVEVIEYLQDNDFTVYVCSGSDRDICRIMLEGIVDIPDSQIIGTDVEYEASGQQGEDGFTYVMTPDDKVVRTDRVLGRNEKTNKVTAIAREIGKQPVLSFGNSGGDASMHIYTISNNPYKSAAFMLIADDGERDYGHPEKADELREKWEGFGFNVISMKDDFRTIYGDGVTKTGTFRWFE